MFDSEQWEDEKPREPRCDMCEYMKNPTSATCDMCKCAIPKDTPFLFLATFEEGEPFLGRESQWEISPRTLCYYCFDKKVSKDDILKLMRRGFELTKGLAMDASESIKKQFNLGNRLSDKTSKEKQETK